VRPLAVDRQTAPVPKALVRADLDLALDVLIDLPTKVTLDRVVLTDPVAEPDDFLVRQVSDACAWIDL
jgi:hypothetical protein